MEGETKRRKKIGIIGAGISGLLACKYTLEKGFNPIVFESKTHIGGVWSQTFETTKLQTPKEFYQFSDFHWPSSVQQTYPDHNQVLGYLESYAGHFDLLSCIKFNSRVVAVDYCCANDDDHVFDSGLWGGTGEAFAANGKWNVLVEEGATGCSSSKTQVYEVDFLILCIGKFSDLPHFPDFPKNQGPEVFKGEVLHSMDYAAMDDHSAAEFIKGKQVTVVGFQKSAVDLASEVSTRNGPKNPCMLLFKKAYWTVPSFLNTITFSGLNRFTEFVYHKPHEGFFLCLLAFLLSPLVWIFEKVAESYFKWKYPLKEYNMVPSHGFMKQIASCTSLVLPDNFYDRVKEGSLILKKVNSFCFSEKGLIIEEEEEEEEEEEWHKSHVKTDIVIFATGYKSDEKLKNIFSSSYFKKCIIGSPFPFYRECIHPRIAQLAILGYAESAATLFTTEMRTKWVVHFLEGKLKLPSMEEMEKDVKEWEKCMKRYAGDSYKRTCAPVLLQIHCNDLLCRDMGTNPRRKSWFLPEIFAPYGPKDYANLTS